MIALALGLGALGLLLWAAQRFSAAEVSSIKALGAWVAALGGLSLVALLMFSGRGATALAGFLLAGPLVWNWWKEAQGLQRGRPSGMPPPSARLGRAEALEVLGLQDPVSDSDVRAAWVRLMRVAHPDGGGTDWLAARVNQARDVLLRER